MRKRKFTLLEKQEKEARAHLSVIRLARSKQGMKRVIARNQESGEINQELASNVEEDEEEVDSHQTEDGVHLGDRSLSFEVVEEGVF